MSTGYRHADHMKALQPGFYRKFLKQAQKTVGKSELKFDTIVFSGMSGAIFAPVLALRLKKEIIMVRKESDKYPTTHSEYRVEGYIKVQRYIIVDDFISSGASAKYMTDQIREHFNSDAKCVGIYSYDMGKFYETTDYRVEDLIYRESSVPKIEAADDPTILRDTSACGCGRAQACADCLESKRGPSSSIKYDVSRKVFVGTVSPAIAEDWSTLSTDDCPPETESTDLSF